MKYLYTAENLAEAVAIQAHLKEQGIAVHIEEVGLAGLPAAVVPGSYPVHQVSVVEDGDLEAARECLRKFRGASSESSDNRAWKCPGCAELMIGHTLHNLLVIF